MDTLKCSIVVSAGVVLGEPMGEYMRSWEITQKDLDWPPTYIDETGAAMNYAMSLQNPEKVNWVKFEWIWM